MKKSQILAALALAFALGVVAPVAGTYAYSGQPGISSATQVAVINTEFSDPTDLAGLVATANAKSVTIKYTGTTDLSLASTINISDGRAVNIDLGGKKLIVTGPAFMVDNGSLAISNGTVESNGVALWLKGGVTQTWTNGVAYASNITIAANATVKTSGTFALGITHDTNAAYGATLDIYGKVIGGITTNGGLTKSGATVNIHDNAKIEGDDIAIFAAGVADWNIDAATITGGDGIYAKAGTINLNGATVKATADYAAGITSNNGGSNTGAALDIEVNAAYAGKVTVNVNAGTTLESKESYAVYQFVSGNALEALNISKDATVKGKLTVNGASIQGVADEKIKYEATTTPTDPSTPSTTPDDTNNGSNAGDDTQDPSAPGTGLVGTAEGNAATTVSIVAGLATALTALGAGVVAYRSARRSNK